MAYCTQCGITYPPDKRFCRECGSPLTDPPAATPAGGLVSGQCPMCGWAVPSGDRFCPQCGSHLGPMPVAADSTVVMGAPLSPPEGPVYTAATQQYTQATSDAPLPSPVTEFRSTTQPIPEEFAKTAAAFTPPAAPEEAVFPPGGVQNGGPVPPSLAKKSHVGVWVVLALVVLGLAGGGLMMWQRTKSKRAAAPLAQQTPSPPLGIPAAPPVAPTPEAPAMDEKMKETLGRMNALLASVETFKNSRKKLPASLLDLGKAMEDPAMRNDGWGNPFIYLADLSNNTFVLTSAGPDGKRDTSDDIKVADETVVSWREQHHEVLDEWRVANLDLYQKLSGEQISSETKASFERKRLEREKAKAEAAAQQAARLAAQQKQQEELRRQQEAAAQQAELLRQQEEARRRVAEEQARLQAEAQRKARQEKMNFVETFEANLRRWVAGSFQAVTEKGKPGMRIAGFGLLKDASDWDNYTAIFDVKIHKEGVNFIVRARDRQNFYFLKLTDDKAKIFPKNSLIRYIYEGGKYIDAAATNEATGAAALVALPFKVRRNDTYHVAISVSGNTIRTSINNQVVDTWQDNTFKQGAFGFNCSAEEQATITSFQMKSN